MLVEPFPRTITHEPLRRLAARPPGPSPDAARPVAGRVAHACRLPGGTLVLVGWYNEDLRDVPPAGLPRLTARRIVFPQPELCDVEGDGREEGERPPPTSVPSGAVGFLAVVAGAGGGEIGAAVIDLGDVAVVLNPERVEVVDVQLLAWLGLAGVGAATRAEVAALLAGVQPFGTEPPAALALALELRRFHDAVRERPPHCSIDAGHPQGLFIDAVHRIDERSFYLRGWMRDACAEVTGLAAIAPEGARAELLGNLVRFPRSDVEQFYGAGPDEQASARSGFLVYFELDAPSHLSEGWALEMRDSAGVTVEAVAPVATDDPSAARAALLADLVLERPGEDTLVRDHAFPALSKLQERRLREGVIDSVTQYGDPQTDPDVTVVVPLYQRIDFLEHQLAHWVHDPDLAAADLVYVLDSPELGAAFAASAAQLHRLYGIPFRTVVLRRNVGYALANNAGVSLARGRLLLLLNSDVLPDAPGWLSTMVRFYDRTPGAGAIGPKLVYEDQSIQHAGMYFQRPDGSSLWENAHYFKGLHRTFPPANVTRPVPAVTGACLLMSLALWERVGGLKGTYVQGDYEDSDLCLRIAELGYRSWYLADVELYHLEGQSYSTQLRRMTSRFNTWLHTHLWGDRIATVMQAASRPERHHPRSQKGAS